MIQELKTENVPQTKETAWEFLLHTNVDTKEYIVQQLEKVRRKESLISKTPLASSSFL